VPRRKAERVSENPFKWLLVLVAVFSAFQLGDYAVRARREIPSILLQLGWAAAAVGALAASPERARVVSPWVIAAGLLVGELQLLLGALVGRAHVRGRYGHARALALCQAVVAPMALHRMTYRALALLHDVQTHGARSPVAVSKLLDQHATPLEDRLIVGASLESLVLVRGWDAIAARFESIREEAGLMPGPGGVACVTALCALGRLADAAAAVDYLDAHPAIPTGPPAIGQDLVEIERYRTKARAIFLAHAGHGALVQRLRRDSLAMRRLFSPDEGARIDEVALAQPALDPPTSALADRIAAEVAAESGFPGTPASTVGRPWATIAIMAVCVLVYLGVALTSTEGVGAALLDPSGDALVTWGALRADLVRGGEAYRLLACTLLHAHVLHLLVNMRALAWLGPVAEHVLGRARFLLVHILAGLSGSLACLLLQPHGIVVGASGAVCGIAGAGVVILRRLGPSSPALWHQRQTREFWGLLIGTAALGALLPFVSNTAHAGGFAAGAAVAALLGGRLPRTTASPRAGVLLAGAVGLAWLLVDVRAGLRTLDRLRMPAAVRQVEYLAWRCGEGDASGCFEAGVIYDIGRGVAVDDARAAGLYQRACDGGALSGCYNSGVMSEYGRGASRDVPRAIGLYQRTCDGGSEWGCAALGNSYRDGVGVSRDDVLAVSLFARSCDAHRTRGCFGLAGMLSDGRGVPRDATRAASLYARSCDAGDARACNNLGDLDEHRGSRPTTGPP
jgi:membrane associated rhomboid family serine protease